MIPISRLIKNLMRFPLLPFYLRQEFVAWLDAFAMGSGWAMYVDSAHTQGSPQSFVAGVPALYTNDGLEAGSNSDYKPGSAEWWSGNRIQTQKLGDTYVLRLHFVVVPGSNDSSVSVTFDIGSDPLGAGSVPITVRTQRLARGNGVPQNVQMSFPIFCLDTFVANGCAVVIETEHNSDIYEKKLLIVKSGDGPSMLASADME